MIVPHAILGLWNKFSVERLKKFKESLHVEYGTTWNRFLPKGLTNF